MAYVPCELRSKRCEEMDMDEFVYELARARYLEEVQIELYKSAIAQVLGGLKKG